MSKNHNFLVSLISNYLKKYEYIHRLFKNIYYYICYLSTYGSNKYKLKNNIIPYFPVNFQSDYFFGYYHNSPWSYNDKFIAISSVIDSNSLQIGIIDKNKFIAVDKTTLWNFQQGAMLGWMPGKNVIYYNKLVEGEYKVVNYNIDTEEYAYFDFPIQAVHPSGEFYFSINYQSMSAINHDYSYKQKCNIFSSINIIGIWKCYFRKTSPELLISLDDLVKANKCFKNNKNDEINHIIFSDNGQNFLFIYRYKKGNKRYSKLILSKTESSNQTQFKIINNNFISHMCWIDDENIFYFGDSFFDTKGYYIYNISTDKFKKVMLENLNDGHPSVSRNKKWILLDSYPDKYCNSHLYLYNIPKNKIVDIGKIRTNTMFQGYNRCDLHPRWNNKGDKIMVDTLYKKKRSSFIIDLGKIINE